MADEILVTVDAGIATVTLNRPDQRNAMNTALLQGLRAAFDGLEDRRDVRVVVVKGASGHVAGLVVDDLVGELQTVIKPLGKLFSHVRGISGTALLGSGDVALILDVNMLVSELVRSSDRLRSADTQWRTSAAAMRASI